MSTGDQLLLHVRSANKQLSHGAVTAIGGDTPDANLTANNKASQLTPCSQPLVAVMTGTNDIGGLLQKPFYLFVEFPQLYNFFLPSILVSLQRAIRDNTKLKA